MDLVNSIVRAVKLLEILKEERDISYIQIAKRIDIPKSTLFKILKTLENLELVHKDGETGRYQLGTKLIELGGSARNQLEITNIARPFMKRLNKELDATLHLTVVAHGEILPIESFESENWYRHHFRYSPAIGVPAPLHCTAPGKAILAHLKQKEIEEIIKTKRLKKYTENTITTKKALLAELKKIVEQGYAVSNGEHDEIIRSVAAPIWNHEGQVIAAMSILGVISKITPERVPAIAKLVTEATKEISRRMGYVKQE
jgi:DNA-binding IclR family transcriptional regulator